MLRPLLSKKLESRFGSTNRSCLQSNGFLPCNQLGTVVSFATLEIRNRCPPRCLHGLLANPCGATPTIRATVAPCPGCDRRRGRLQGPAGYGLSDGDYA